MLKRRYCITAAILGLSVMAAGVPAAAAEKQISSNGNGIYVVSGQEDIQKIKEQLENLGDNVRVIDLTGNGQIDCEIPGWGGNLQPEGTPETNLPETEQPEMNPPEDAESEMPETNVPETNAPEDDTPEDDIPETNIPETEQPDTETLPPQTEVPETNTQDTETEQPETEQPDTEKSYAMQVIDLVNHERSKEGLAALKYDEASAKAAFVRAKESEISFSHTRPNGTNFSTALTESGASFKGAGENIAYGQKTPEEVVKGWMNSPGHRANIMNEKFTKIGVGHYQNSKGINYWAQLFTY